MKIINFSPLKTSQIKKAIKLLPKEYQFDMPIFILSNPFIAFFVRLFYNLNFELKDFKTTGGFLNYDFMEEKPAYIVIFYHSRVSQHFFGFCETLYHELRHAYQSTYMRHMFTRATANYNTSMGDDYLNHPVEKDARRFARNALQQHRKSLNTIGKTDVKHMKFDKNTQIINYIKDSTHEA